MLPNQLTPPSLRRWYRVWLIGGILFSIACVYNLFFAKDGRSDPLTYIGILVPFWWLGCAGYGKRRLRYLAQRDANTQQQ